MGYFRFRKQINVLPGVHVNLSKTGVSTSVGGKGATFNIGHGKKNVTLGIPGTGLSYRTPASSQLRHRRRRTGGTAQHPPPPRDAGVRPPRRQCPPLGVPVPSV